MKAHAVFRGISDHPSTGTGFKTYPDYRDSGVDWLGDIPTDWKIAPLHAAVRSCWNGIWGNEPDGEHDVACLRVAEFDRFRATIRTDEPTIRSVEPRYREHREIEVGDLLLEKSGGGDKQPVGFVVLVTQMDRAAVCSNFIARLRVREEVSPSFLRFVFLHLYNSRVNTRSIKQTTGIQNLDADHYLSTKVALPSAPTQQRIAKFLESTTASIEQLIAKKERLIELLEERRTALITKAVTNGLDPDVPMKDSGVEWLGDIPQEWGLTKLKHCLQRIATGATPTSGRREYWLDGNREEGYPWAAISDVTSTDRLRKTQKRITAKALDDFRLDEVPPGALLYTIYATLGEVAHLEVPSYTNQAILGLVPREELVLSPFLFWWLKAIRPQVGRFSSDNTQKNLSQEGVRRFPVPLPPRQEQQKIIRVLSDSVGMIHNLAGEIRGAVNLLEEYRSALISAAVTGKIDVRDHAA